MVIKSVINKCKKGDQKAQRELFDLSRAMLNSVALRYCDGTISAEDILQEAYIRIYKALPKFQYQNDAATFGWMKRILVTEAIREIKKSKKWDTAESTREIETSQPSSHLEYDDLYAMLQTLPLQQRVVFSMYAIEGYSHKEIAAHLEIGESSSRSNLTRARRSLQSILQTQQVYEKV